MAQITQDEKKDVAIRVLRIMAAVMAVIGVVIFFDIYGVASRIGIAQGGIKEIVGGVIIITAAIDVLVIPRIVLGASSRMKKRSRDE